MKKIYPTISFIFLIFSSISGQEFASVVNNPFGLISSDSTFSSIVVSYVDMDNDSDLDIVHFGIVEDTFSLSIQKNIGSPTNPIFGPHERTDLSNTKSFALILADMGDLNDDGLMDIFAFGAVDSLDGYYCVIYTNTTIGNKLTFERSNTIELGLPALGDAFFFPELVDLNDDGDLDILLSGGINDITGEDLDGAIYYGQNLGNLNAPTFSGWHNEAYGLVVQDTFQLALSTAGDLDMDGDMDVLSIILLTDDIAEYHYFENTAPIGQRPNFATPVISPFNLVDSFGTIQLADIDGDSDLDLLLFGGEEDVRFFENISCTESYTEFNGILCYGDTIHLGGKVFDDAILLHDTLQNQGGCDSLVVYNVSAIIVDTTVSLTDITLSASNMSADAYQWIDCATNMPIPGETSFNFTPSTSGSYAALITEGSCMKQSNCMMVIVSGTLEFSDLDISLSPNPADDVINFNGVDDLQFSQVSMVDVNGKTYNLHLEQNQLNVSNLPTGFYILLALIDGKKYAKTINIY